ncbi:MAG: preprotein translocase subunit SecG [Alphaproteobacteria bacterium]|nr:preprotein translocase subunit SecG [Alphaproteobacteria bacterium]
MTLLHNIVLLVQILSALGMIGLVLVQHGKGADMGAAFGSGGSGSLFGATGGANFLSRATAVLATVFFLSTLGLAYLGSARPEAPSTGSVLERTAPSSVPTPVGVDPAVPAPAAGVLSPAATPEPKAPVGNIPR